jgi:hypothetical protein
VTTGVNLDRLASDPEIARLYGQLYYGLDGVWS